MSNIDSLIKRGEACYSEGLYDSAIASYGQAMAAGEESSQLYCLRAKAYLAKGWEAAGRAPSGEEAYEKWAAAFGDSPEVELAHADAQRAVELDPKNSDAWYGLGVILMDKRLWTRAVEAFDKCQELHPDDFEAKYWQAVAFDEMGDTARALETLDAVLAMNEDCHEACYMRAQIRADKDELAPALADIARAIELDPETPEYHLEKGRILYFMAEKPEGAARLPEAIEDFTEALRLEPEYAEAYNWRSLAYLQAGDDRRELADLDALIKLEPANAEAYKRRYDCHAACGHRAEAAGDWLYLCTLDPRAAADPFKGAAGKATEDFKKLRGN